MWEQSAVKSEKLNQTSYDVSGCSTSPAVALIHGIGLDRSIWQGYNTALSQHYQVISYDLWGHGKSGVGDKPINLSTLSHQLLELLDHLSIKTCALVGFSLGGMINRKFAISYPSRVSSLVVLNSPHERSLEQQKAIEERAFQTQQTGIEAMMENTIRRWFTPSFIAEETVFLKQIQKKLRLIEPDLYLTFRQLLATGVHELVRPNPPITAPTLCITSENDVGSTPKMAHAISAEITDSETLIMPCLQHMGLVEKPQFFLNPLLEFLEKNI